MKKTLKRLLSLIIATFLILSFSIVPAIATQSDPTTWTLTTEDARPTLKTITVNKVYSHYYLTVTAYQIIKGTYKDGKLTGYELCDSVNAPIANITAPTAKEITDIANYIDGHPTALASVQMTSSQSDSSTYTATVEAGEYIILARKSPNITGSPGYVYNPAIVAVNVTDANLVSNPSSTGGTVDMTTYFQQGQTNVYMKSSEIEFFGKKVVIDANNISASNTASYGDTVNFKVYNDNIPSYSEDYARPLIYKITDDLYLDHSAATPFLGVSGLTVKIGTMSNGVFTGSEVPQVTGEGAEAVRNYTVKYYDKNGNEIQNPTAENLTQAVKYEIEFADALIRANGMKYLEVTYSSTLTTNAKLAISNYTSALVSNETRATLNLSDDPADANSYNEYTNAITSTYTFGIDSGNNNNDTQTYELNKVTQAGETYTSVKNVRNKEISKKSPYALAGATFTIYSDRAMTQDQDHIIGTATSDANGHIEFRGLGAGTYYLKETAAPSGYTLNENNYKIVISATIQPWGEFTSYNITTYLMGETDTQIGSATYTKSGSYITPNVTPAEVVNTQLATLPTTGGVGTIVISVIAGLGMAIFLTVFVISKKRSSKKN